jgi:hypothetical protein
MKKENNKVGIIILFVILGLLILGLIFNYLILPYVLNIYQKKADIGFFIKEKLMNPFVHFFKTPNRIPPRLKLLLEKIGNYEIEKIWVCRNPLPKAIRYLSNVVSRGEFIQRYETLGYDDIYHLYMVLQVKKPNGGTFFYKLEKNVQVSLTKIQPTQDLQIISKCRQVTLNKSRILTILEFLNEGKKFVKLYRPEEYFWTYDPELNNCQHFLVNLLDSQGLLTDDLEYFIDQAAPELIAKFPILNCFARRISGGAELTSCLINFRDSISEPSPSE